MSRTINQYALLEPVLWQAHVRPAPVYSNTFLRDFWQADRDAKLEAHHQILTAHVWDLLVFVGFLIGWPLALCMLAGGASAVARPGREASAGCSVSLAYVGPALDTRVLPHYAAAEAVLAYMLAACALARAEECMAGRGRRLSDVGRRWSSLRCPPHWGC